MNPTRRDMIAAVSGAVVAEVAPYARPAKAQPANNLAPDPVLAFRQAWEEAEAQVDAAQAELDIVSAGYERQSEPAALCWRESDTALLGDAITGHPETGPGKTRTGRRIYSSPKDIDAFRIAVEYLRLNGGGEGRETITERQIARLDEIIGADDDWHRETRARWKASGMDEAERAIDEAAEAAKAVRLRIVRTRAATLDGVMFKVRVAARCFGDDPVLAAETLWCLGEPSGAGDDVVSSVFLDLMRLADDGGA